MVASHLGGRTVQDAQESLTSTGFLKWVWYLEWDEFKRQKKLDYYLAQIAVEIERTRAKNPKKSKIEDKLIQFNTEKKVLSKKTRLRRSWIFWKGLVGLKNRKRKKVPRKVWFKKEE